MSRYDDFRSSTGSLGGVSSSDAGGGRWDAERFARERSERHADSRDSRAPPVLERPREDERDRNRERRVPTFEERFSREERYGPPARRPDTEYDDDHLVSGAGPPTAGSMVPFDRRRREPAGGPPPPRPGLLRRQSSLDTFDRKPMRHRGYDRDDYSPPPAPRAIPVQLPRRQRTPPRYHDRDYEDVRVAEPEYYGDEEYRHIREEDVIERRRRSSSSVSHRERRPVHEEKPFPRRGKTRMPKRMVHTRAIIELGYPFEEFGDSIVILKALGKENIDEVVQLSREMKRREAYSHSPQPRRRDRGMSRERIVELERERIVTSPPREREHLTVEMGRSSSRRRPHTPERLYVEEREVREISPRPRRSQSVSVRPSRRRRSTPGRGVERREMSPGVGQEIMIVQPDRYRDQDIRDEIRALEEERRALRMERGHADLVIEDTERDEVVEVKKDRKGRMSLVR
ncbi:hypothetical protein FQN54_003006 [Arachnomyces sp. PD_36]|nr:hypothetical protein FQN54_003006 [Arachnomyces sp. PD_36]